MPLDSQKLSVFLNTVPKTDKLNNEATKLKVLFREILLY